MRPTAPGPILGVNNKFALHWIPVHVVQFLPQFLVAPHVKVVEAALPKCRGVELRSNEGNCSCAAGDFFGCLRKARETFCLSTCKAFDGFPRFGSLRSRWMCSGMTT